MATKKVVLNDGTEVPFEVPEGARVEEVRAAAEAAVAGFVRTRSDAPQEEASPAAVAEQAAVPPPQPPVEQAAPVEESGDLNALDYGVAAADIGGSLVTGGFGSIAGGLAGLAGLAYGAATGEGANATANKWLDSVSDALTWNPKSRGGKLLLETVAPTLVEAQATMRDGIEFVAQDNVAIATALETTLLGAVELLGVKGLRSSTSAANNARRTANATKKALKEMGINPKNKTIRESIVESARAVAPEARGQHIEVVEETMRSARDAARKNVTALYKKARESDVFFDVETAQNIARSVRQSLIDDGFEVASSDFERIMTSLDKLENIGTVRPSTGEVISRPVLATKFNELEIVRRQFGTQARELSGGASTAAARAKKAIDDSIVSSLNDMNMEAGRRIKFGEGAISGDAQGIQWWTDARAASSKFKDTFETDKIIMDMIHKGLSPEEVATSVLGASALGSKKSASRIIKKIKDGTGADSNVMDALRAEVMYNITEPLLGVDGAPNFNRFASNYQLTMKRNPSMMKELGLDQGPLKMLADSASTAAGLPLPGRAGAAADLIPKFLASRFGHQIAKKGFQQNMLKKLFSAIMGGQRVKKSEIIRSIAGIDPELPLFANKPKFVAEIALTQMPTSLQTLIEEAQQP